MTDSPFILRNPSTRDGLAMFRIARESEALEENTAYAYLLLATHFSDTCLVAERNGDLVGYVAAYRPPAHPESIFVWQIGVDRAARRQGLARRMLLHLLTLPACWNTKYLESTVTPSNKASRGLFESAAAQLGVPHRWSKGFEREDFGDGDHEPENLFRAGPIGD
jgi:L-2,4-diaminobutyric acid acetyltransferase